MPSRMKLPSIAAALALAAGLVAAAVAPAAADKLTLGNEGVYPPFSIVAPDGKLTGFEPELAREVCKRIGAECEFVVMDFKALIPSLLQGKFDLLASQLSPTPERLEKLTYGTPIVYNPATFVVKKDTDYTFTPEGLSGKGLKIGLQRGASSIPYIDKHFADTFEKVLYDNPDQMRLDLMAGRIDLVFDSKLNWTFELIMKPDGKDWKLAGGDHWLGDPAIAEDKRGYSWAVPKGQEALIERFNKGIDEVIADCTFTKIRKEFLDVAILTREAPCVK